MIIYLEGRGSEYGIGTLTPAQYQYWIDKPEEALVHHCSFPDEDTEIPQEARIGYWDEATDIAHAYGCYLEQTNLVVVTDDLEIVIFEQPISELFDDPDQVFQVIESNVLFDEERSNHFFYGANICEGAFFMTRVLGNDFDLSKVVLEVKNINHELFSIRLESYDGIESDEDDTKELGTVIDLISAED